MESCHFGFVSLFETSQYSTAAAYILVLMMVIAMARSFSISALVNFYSCGIYAAGESAVKRRTDMTREEIYYGTD